MTSVEAMRPDSLDTSLSTTFDVVAWEIELAAARCIFLDSLVGRMLKEMPEKIRESFQEDVHTVDLLCQQLTGLSAFTRQMSGNVAPDVSAYVHTALDVITLGALADRMTVALGGVEKDINDGDGAGDLDLF